MSINYDFEAIQEQAHCNWCRNPMVMSAGPLTEANFVDTGKKYPALYCSGCLAIEARVKQPKMAINPDTLDEYDIAEMPDVLTKVEKEKEKEKEDETGN